MQQVTASTPGDQDIGSHGSGDGWLTALAVHRGSFVPLHRQIHDLVRQEIVAGHLAPGNRLPSEGALAEQWGVSLAPVRQAPMHLAAEGYLGRRRGRGTFVRHEFVRAERVTEAVHATDEEAGPLGVGTGAMVLRMDSVTYDRADEAVEFSKILYRVERFRFSFKSHRFDDRILHFPSPAAKSEVRKR
jgi:DNA-binding GntR family transcriptional regulator